MATVYLARDLKHNRPVALKLLNPELGAVLGVERFLAEINVTANLQHPNLLPLFDSGAEDGLLFYVMPYAEGESLRVRLNRERQLPVEEAVRIAVSVAGALDYAHQHGIIHRDLKPENILLHAGQPVLADFGIALAVAKAGGARITQTGLSLGTPHYMSPEQATGDRVIDGRADIYSLGAVLYEMLVGDPPHTGSTAQAIISKVLTESPRAVRAARPNVGEGVELAIERALEKLPADRFATAQEFAAALTDQALRSTTGSRSAGRRPTKATPRWSLYGIATFAMLMTVAALWGWLRRATPKPVVRYSLIADSSEALLSSLLWGRMAISPDGSRLVYVGGPDAHLLLRPRSQLTASPLAGGESAQTPFFSPDGERVGFIVNSKTLRLVSLNGDLPVNVTDSLVGVAGGSWGPDGLIYVSGAGESALVRVAPNPGAVPRWFTVLDTASGEIHHSWPDALPNGRGVLFTVAYAPKNTAAARTNYAIAVADVPTGKHRVLVNDAVFARYAVSGHLVYVTASGTLMIVPFDQRTQKLTGTPTAVSEGLRLGSFGSADLAISATGTLVYVVGGAGRGNRELVWVTRDGKVQDVDSTWQGGFGFPNISPDGTRLAVSIASGGASDNWTKELDRGPNVRMTFEGSINEFPTWTPDGRSVTFYSNVSGSLDLWTKRADGSAPAVRLLHRAPGLSESVWSPDGRWLIFRAENDILAVRPGADTVPTPLIVTKFKARCPTLSPDGRWLAYVSNETGRNEIYVVPFPSASAAKWTVSTRGGTEPRWSHSGRELFYRDGVGSMISVEVKTTPTFSHGRETSLFPTAAFLSSQNHQQYAVAKDDRRFLMIRPSRQRVPERLIVVENWFEELKPKASK